MKRITGYAVVGLAFAAALTATQASAVESDADVCTAMKTMVDTINKQQEGKMIDQVTKGETATADCDARVLALKWSVNVPATQMKAGWQDMLKGNIEKVVCRDVSFMDGMAAGWKVTGTWTLKDTAPYTAEVNCN